jgi:membrane-bound lytic murein transglycosylase D
MRLLLSVIFLFAAVAGKSATYSVLPDTAHAELTIREDDPIAAMMDSLMNLKFFDYISKNERPASKYNFAPDSVPYYDDAAAAEKMAKLNARTPFNLDYNDAVKPYIKMYAERKREQTERMLSLSKLYFPMFEEKLAKYNIPLELKHLAVIESALNAGAKSRAGAMGLWQFMYGTGKMFGLDVNSYVDERSDPLKSTEAACQYLSYLYNMYNDWHLVLAAYNAGPGNVNKAIRRSGGKRNYWELRPFLPAETRGYVPVFIAATYIFSYAEEYNLHATQNIVHYFQTDTVRLKQPLHFDQIAQTLNVDPDEVRFLNPVYKKNIIPCIDNRFNVLCLPKSKIADFINNEDLVYNKGVENSAAEGVTQMMAVVPASQETRKTHVVRSGETLSVIAKKYRCSVQDIREWNRLKSNNLMAGQKLTVYVHQPAKTAPAASPAAAKQISADTDKKDVKYIYHTVQSGDTLYKIAEKYKGVSAEDIKQLNNMKNINSLKIGEKLKIAVAG